MRTAPPIEYPVSRGLLERCALSAAAGGAGAALAAWACGWGMVYLRGPIDARLLAVAALAGAMLASAGGWRAGACLRRHAGLVFDGSAWRLAADPGAPPDGRGRGIDVMIDLGRWMLLRLRPEAEPAAADWVAVKERDLPGTWPALRTLLWHASGDAAAAGAGP